MYVWLVMDPRIKKLSATNIGSSHDFSIRKCRNRQYVTLTVIQCYDVWQSTVVHALDQGLQIVMIT